jgi:outer membrane protein assembly factor BamE (lipoprotein component of BamABCDE complex)
LSEVDRHGIEAGKALPGMSKQGVTIALGYPAKHKTPSLESNEWVYWTSAHDPITINFDQSGKVVK